MNAVFSDLKKRVIISTICVVVVAILIYFSNNAIVQLVAMVVVGALAITGIWEYVQLLKIKNIELPFWLLSTLTGLFIIANYLTVLSLGFSIVLQCVVVVFFFSVFIYNFYKIHGAIIKIAATFFGAFYIVMPIGLMLRILYPISISTNFVDGRVWLAYLIVVTKITDIGGYFAGKLWGRGKLAPTISPGKTMTGAFAGFISAILVSIIFFLISTFCIPSISNIFNITFVQSIVLGGIIGIFSQFGDLAESLLKRDANVKDSNNIPGIGGVLDMLDSLLFTTPILYLFLRTITL